MQTSTSTSHTLDVPGARLYYEVRGAGPLLALIAAPMGAAAFTGLADLLADRFTVLTYDPRGISRSVVVDDPAGEDTPQRRAEDIHRLLQRFGDEPARVFASSGGALTGLALVAAHPEQVHTLIAHEPPLVALLPDHAALQAGHDDIVRISRVEGPDVAMLRFLMLAGVLDVPDGAAPGPTPEVSSRQQQADNRYFIEHMLDAAGRYTPDLDALHAATTRVVIAGGTTSQGQVAQRGAVALADLLDTPLVELPGDHMGWLAEPEASAHVLRQLLTQPS